MELLNNYPRLENSGLFRICEFLNSNIHISPVPFENYCLQSLDVEVGMNIASWSSPGLIAILLYHGLTIAFVFVTDIGVFLI